MGFNIHILSVRNRSTNLPSHAALAASFNPGCEQITSDASAGSEASGISKNTIGSLVLPKTSFAPAAVPPTAIVASPVGVEAPKTVNPMGESEASPGVGLKVKPVVWLLTLTKGSNVTVNDPVTVAIGATALLMMSTKLVSVKS